MRDISATSPATLLRARDIARQAGLRYVYTGNIRDEAGQSTYCHDCGACMIGRDGYTITSWALDAHGHCPLAATVRGLVEAAPGRGAHAVPRSSSPRHEDIAPHNPVLLDVFRGEP